MVSQPSRFAAAALLVPATAFIALMTLRPAAGPTIPLPFACIFCGTLGGVDFLLNTVLFVPFGLAIYWLLGSKRATVAAGFAFTLVIEALQWQFIPGRDASLGDLVANTLGTVVGVMLAVLGSAGLYAIGRRARILAASFAVFGSLVIVVTGWLLQPAGVRHALAVQWKASRPNMDDFAGDVRKALVNGTRIYPFQWIGPREFLEPGSLTVSVEADISRGAAPTARQSIIVRLANRFEEGFLLGQWKDAVIVRSHQVAEKLRFRSLLVGFDGVLEAEGTADYITMKATSNPRAISLLLTEGREATRLDVRRSVGLGWTLILPWDVAVTPRWWVANAAWLAALLLPVGFFTFRSGRHRNGAGVVVASWPLLLTVGTLLITSRVFGLSSPGIGEWIGVIAGIVAGGTLEKLIPTHLPAPLNPSVVAGTIQS